jgi:iron(III) transport system ATP-binding protein
LSGGQQQRLALARALVKEPGVLLLDEPLSNLDAKLREETRLEIRDLVKRLGITTLYVTHDQIEALTMSDVVAVMNEGTTIQEGSPIEIYQAPRERFVANFIGMANFIEGRVTSRGELKNSFGRAETPCGLLECTLPDGTGAGDGVVIMVRPEDISVASENALPCNNVVEGKVGSVIFMGDSLECEAHIGKQRLRLKLHPFSKVAHGDTIRLELPPERCRAIRGGT